MKREVPKIPSAPLLNDKAKNLLTELCFYNHEPVEKAELIFIYGSPFFIDEIASQAATLLSNSVSDQVLISGGINPYDKTQQQKSEATLIYEKLLGYNLQGSIHFTLETASRNTLENVENSLSLIDLKQYKNICFIFPSHSAKRGYLTLKKFLPSTKILASPYDVAYPEEGGVLSKESWHTFELGIRRVWGEFLRIKEYGSRGDISYPKYITELVQQIEKQI